MFTNRIYILTLLTLLPTHTFAVANTQQQAPPNGGRGAGTVPIWNGFRPDPENPPLTLRVLVLNYDPIVRAEGHRRLSELFGWSQSHDLATQFIEAMEFATGGYLRHEIIEWRNLNAFYHQEGGYLPTCDEYVRNRRSGSGWREPIVADYPLLLAEQNVAPRIDAGEIDEVWIFSDHFFGLWEASMAGPGAFFINGGVYPGVPTRRPFAFYGFNYERGVAEMMHNAAHRTEATMNRAFGEWNLRSPKNMWEKFSANNNQSDGRAGVGTCHWPPNAQHDYDYANTRAVDSWADAFLRYPDVEFQPRRVTRDTWSTGPDFHLDYMKWYFAHLPRAAGTSKSGHRHNWLAYIFDFQAYDAFGKPARPSTLLIRGDVADPSETRHLLQVCYRSHMQVDPETLGADDLEVSGPDGGKLAAMPTLGTGPHWVSDRVVNYSIEAPSGGWKPGGRYRVSLRKGVVKTRQGQPFPAGPIGEFTVAGDDGVLSVAWPSKPLEPGMRHSLQTELVTKSKQSVAPSQQPVAIAWRSSNPEVVDIEVGAVLRANRPGKSLIEARRGGTVATKEVTVRDSGLPEVQIIDAGTGRFGGGEVLARLQVTAKSGLRRETITTGAFRVVCPNGYQAFPRVKSAEMSADGRSCEVVLQLSPRVGNWSREEVGVHRIELLGWRIGDQIGRFAAPVRLGKFLIAL